MCKWLCGGVQAAMRWGGGPKDFSVSPRPLWSMKLWGLGWGWVFGTKVLGPGLDNIQTMTQLTLILKFFIQP